MKKLLTLTLLLVVSIVSSQVLELYSDSVTIIEYLGSTEVKRVESDYQFEVTLTPRNFEINSVITKYSGYVEGVEKVGDNFRVLTNSLGSIRRLDQYEPEILISKKGEVTFIVKFPGANQKIEYILKRKKPLSSVEKEILLSICK